MYGTRKSLQSCPCTRRSPLRCTSRARSRSSRPGSSDTWGTSRNLWRTASSTWWSTRRRRRSASQPSLGRKAPVLNERLVHACVDSNKGESEQTQSEKRGREECECVNAMCREVCKGDKARGTSRVFTGGNVGVAGAQPSGVARAATRTAVICVCVCVKVRNGRQSHMQTRMQTPTQTHCCIMQTPMQTHCCIMQTYIQTHSQVTRGYGQTNRHVRAYTHTTRTHTCMHMHTRMPQTHMHAPQQTSSMQRSICRWVRSSRRRCTRRSWAARIRRCSCTRRSSRPRPCPSKSSRPSTDSCCP